MSVIRSKRGESDMEFIHTARELQLYSIRKCANFPKRYTFYLGQPVAHASMRIYEYVKMANSVYPTNAHEVQIRRDYFIRANAELQSLISQIEICCELFGLDPASVQHWMDLADKETRLVQWVLSCSSVVGCFLVAAVRQQQQQFQQHQYERGQQQQ